MLGYATILLAFVQLSMSAIAHYYKSVSECTRQILGNAFGILIGTCVMLLFEKLLSNNSGIIAVIIFSSVMAFFVLGTFCPLAHKTSLGNGQLRPFTVELISAAIAPVASSRHFKNRKIYACF
jgi:hypothetical protein